MNLKGSIIKWHCASIDLLDAKSDEPFEVKIGQRFRVLEDDQGEKRRFLHLEFIGGKDDGKRVWALEEGCFS